MEDKSSLIMNGNFTAEAKIWHRLVKLLVIVNLYTSVRLYHVYQNNWNNGVLGRCIQLLVFAAAKIQGW